MVRNFFILAVLVVVLALPFVFRQEQPLAGWTPGDPVLTVISPHNEAIRSEFGRAFSDWHHRHHGTAVYVDWRSIGGTTEIMRYLQAEYISAFRAWWRTQGHAWPVGGAEMIFDSRFDATAPPEDPQAFTEWRTQKKLYDAFRKVNDSSRFGCRIDLFFGGGSYDHERAEAQGLTVPPWSAGAAPAETISTTDGILLIPHELAGETWRSDTFFGTALSTFGIIYNVDRINDLAIPHPPQRWQDLTDPRYFAQLGVADPTKSGSIAKAFEMMIQEQCRLAVTQAGFSAEQIAAIEADADRGLPAAYQAAVERGWRDGIHLVQRIGANARYFTESAGKVPVDVGMGNAAAGLAIDFYGRFEAEVTTPPGGPARMVYLTPGGGSSVSADPISLLRGAPQPDLARRFITFALSEEGQKLWNYRVGAPGGPQQHALRRLPIRRDFYPAPEQPVLHARYQAHRQHTRDDLGAPDINPYALAERFHYYSRWTGRHFHAHRYLIRAMCLDAGDELRAAWREIIRHGGPEQQPAAMALLQRLPQHPEPLGWHTAPQIVRSYPVMDFMREWTVFFRNSYQEARAAVVKEPAL